MLNSVEHEITCNNVMLKDQIAQNIKFINFECYDISLHYFFFISCSVAFFFFFFLYRKLLPESGMI